MLRLLSLTLLAALILTAQASGVPCCSIANITAAIHAASNGQVVNIDAGTFTGLCGLTMGGRNKALTIGGSTLAPTVIQCSNTNAAPFAAFNLVNEGPGDVLTNLQITTSTRANGTAIVLQSSQLVASGLYIYGFDTGIYANSSTLALLASTLTDNQQILPGGVYSCGGAVYATSSSISVSSVTVSLNSATYGAGMWLDTCISSVSSCTFSGNNGAFDGGGIMAQLGTLAISNSLFVGNSASSGKGGGLVARYIGTQVTVTNSNFTNNWGANSGCIDISQSTMTIRGSAFTGCKATGGGTIGAASSAEVYIYDSTFVNGYGAYAAFLRNQDPYVIFSVTRCNFTLPPRIVDSNYHMFYSPASSDQGCLNLTFCNFNGGYDTFSLTCTGRAFVTDSNFTNMMSAMNGYGGDVIMQRNRFVNVGVQGGNLQNPAVLFIQSGNAYITDNLFANNTADAGALQLVSTAQVYRNTFINNFASAAGAAIHVLAGSHYVRDCIFINNSLIDGSSQMGGAIGVVYVSPYVARLTVTGCTFTGNSARLGAAIGFLTDDQGSALIADCQFYNHSAPIGYGGAIYSSTNLVVRNSLFVNTNAYFGGVMAFSGIYSNEITNVTVRNAFATANGGVMFTIYAIVSVNQVSCSQMTAASGGVLYGDVGALYLITNGSFTQNTVSGSGGAICASRTVAVNAYFAQNSATMGGAVSGFGTGACSFTNSTFINNAATESGGAVATSIQGSLTLITSTLANNNAGSFGGAAFVNYVSYGVVLDRTTIRGNSANAGGGLYLSPVVDVGVTAMQDCIIADNSAGFLGGGGLYLGGCMTLQRTRITGNSSPLGQGGGIYSVDTLTIQDGLIDSNSASAGGGIYCRLCGMNLKGNLVISNNQANDGGGFWCNLGASFLPAAGVTFSGNQQTIQPSLSNHCECGCCTLPTAPASITGADCILSSGRSCNYGCDLGYLVAAPMSQLICNTSVPATPNIQPARLCIPRSCPFIIPNANCTVDQPMPTAYTTDTATFAADLGFTLTGGNKTVTCRGPTWLGEYPTCVPNNCSTLMGPVCGGISSATGRNGDVVEYFCDFGYTRTGPATNKCLNTGFWLNGPPTCTAIGCDVLPAPGNGSVFLDPQPSTGAVAVFRCNDGYLLDGNDTIHCLGGNWSDPSPVCNPRPCPEMLPPANGFVFNANATTGDHATFTCTQGFYLVGAAQVLCLAPYWQNTAPLCHPVVCNTTDHTDLQSSCPDLVAYGTSCTFSCVAGTSGGTPTAICGTTAEAPRGAFVPDLGLCSPCNAGSFSIGGPDSLCTLCPNLGLTPSTRTTSQAACLCAPGFYEATPGAGDCVGCPSGGFCAGNKDQPIAAPGFFKNSDIFSPCSPSVACVGNNMCDEGYTGFACGACKVGYYRLNGYCYICPNDGPWRIILLVLGGLVAVRALIAVVAPESVGDRTYGLVSVNIALSFLQIVATFSDLRIRWPPATRALYDAFSLVNLNIEIVNPECVAPLTFWDKIEIQLLMPIIVLALFLVVWAAMVVTHFVRNKYPPMAAMRFHALKLAKISAAGYMFFMILAYLFLAKASLTLFACNYQGGDVYTLALSPSNECYKGPWLTVAPLAVFGIIAYIVAVPIVVHVVYLRSRRQYGAAVANNSLFSNFLVAKFRSRTWFWEVAVMLRKLLMVIVATFGVGDTYSQVAASFAVILLSVLFSLPAEPYKWRKHNLVEHASLFSALAVLFCGLLLSADSIASNPASVAAIDALIVTAVFVFIFAVLGCLALEIRVYFAVLKLKSRLQPDKVASLQACNARIVLATPFRSTILTVSEDGSVRAWHADTLLPFRAFEMRERVTYATVRGTELYVANDKGLVVWNIDRQAAVEMRSMQSPITAVSSTEAFLCLGHENGDLSFYPFKNQAKLVETDCAVQITDTSDSAGVAVPTTITLTPTAGCLAGEARIVPGAHKSAVTALKPIGLVLYAADRAGCIGKWSLKSFKCFRQWRVAHLPTGVYISAIEEVATQIAVGTSDGVLRFLSAEAENNAVHSLRLQIARISALSLCSGMLLSASEDGRIIVLSGATRGLLQMLPDAEAAVTCLSVLEDGTVVYGDAKGVLRKYCIIPEWHMREPDPHVLTKLFNYVKTRWLRRTQATTRARGESSAAGMELPAAAQQDIYDELGVLAESLDLPAIPWRVLDGASAEAVALALAGETQKRRENRDGLRRRQQASSSFAP